jgi:quercetin dioxygenase-like cupin family protein
MEDRASLLFTAMTAPPSTITALTVALCFAVCSAAFGCRHDSALTLAPAASAPAGTSVGIRRTIIGRTPAHEAGWETRLYLIEYPPGAAAAPHTHPVVGVGWVVEGEFESAFGDGPVTKVGAGQSFTDLADVRHRLFRNTSADHPLRFVIAYTIRSGDENFRSVP